MGRFICRPDTIHESNKYLGESTQGCQAINVNIVTKQPHSAEILIGKCLSKNYPLYLKDVCLYDSSFEVLNDLTDYAVLMRFISFSSIV